MSSRGPSDFLANSTTSHRDSDLKAKEHLAVESIGEVAEGAWEAVLARSAAEQLTPHGRLSLLPKAAQRDAAAAVRDLRTCTVELTARSVIAMCQRASDAELTTRLEELASDEHGESIQARLDSARETARVLAGLGRRGRASDFRPRPEPPCGSA